METGWDLCGTGLHTHGDDPGSRDIGCHQRGHDGDENVHGKNDRGESDRDEHDRVENAHGENGRDASGHDVSGHGGHGQRP